ncbi:unnamed protein product [Zymoseptoria tritici ST99CH_3D1]|uniref:Uncharacterized protein n=1 Tax=Zymoseptoria tritici ST99CH_1E4 TaxID=1276532 RepID=A0A2H1H5I9_ZYMTR|nr:unnamed protein product [Zymoseptoria tritici ST99CH_1E4]SMR64213.1 unnamed protein product [Zymoseptoria tritici ST99CH_3D1]
MFLLSIVHDLLGDLNITYIVLGSGFGLGILIYTLRFLIANRNPTALRRPPHKYETNTARTQSAPEFSELEAVVLDKVFPSIAREGIWACPRYFRRQGRNEQ